MDKLTSDDILAFIMVALVLIQTFNMFMQARTNYKTMRAEKLTYDDIKRKYDAEFSKDRQRLDKLEKEFIDIRNGQRAGMIGIRALLGHALHNGNSDEMQSASDEIDKYYMSR